MRHLTLTVIAVALLLAGNVKGQYAIFTMRCDSTMAKCDTVLAEYYNKNNKLARKVKMEEERTLILYEYDSAGHLTGKKHRNERWELQKYEKYTLNEQGEWMIDSMFGKTNELLMTLVRKPSDQPDVYFVNWFFRYEETPMTVQKIKTDSSGNELSNSTCYAVDNCVTYVFRYEKDRKTGVELWELGPDKFGVPVLKESEELVYDERGQLIGRVRYREPEHEIIERNKYLRVEGLLPVKKY